MTAPGPRGWLGDYAYFLRHHPAWWLLPPLLVLLALFALVWMGGSGGMADFVYNV